MNEDFHVRLRSDPRLLCALRWLVRGYVSSFGYSDRLDQIVLAVDEACANAIRHSYAGRHEEQLSLLLRADEGQIEIELRDEGTPIPRACTCPPPEDRVEAERLHPGGLGIYLIHRAFDEVIYEPGPERGNRVLMRLHAPPRQEVEHAPDIEC
jgi:anti-sigma regulatory factor (Ser/Thr protein kinase)